MAFSGMTNSYNYGGGSLLLGQFKPGTTAPTGFIPVGHTTNLALSVEIDRLEHENVSDGPIREIDRDIPIRTKWNIRFDTDNISPENMARALAGDIEKVTQASAANVSETLTDVVKGGTYQLGVSAANPVGARKVAITTVTVGGVEKDVDVDYWFDGEYGQITFSVAGTVEDGDDVTVTYSVGAATFDRVASGSKFFDGAMRFKSDLLEGQNFTIFMPRVSLSLTGDLQLLGGEWQTLSFEGKALKVPGRAAVYRDGVPLT